jgi:hypothetical protein
MVSLRFFLDSELCVCEICLRFLVVTPLLRNSLHVPCFCFQAKDRLKADRPLPQAKGLATSFLTTSMEVPDLRPFGVG